MTKISPALVALEDAPSGNSLKKLDKWAQEALNAYREKLKEYEEKHRPANTETETVLP